VRNVRATDDGVAPAGREGDDNREYYSISVPFCNLHLHFETMCHWPVSDFDLLPAQELIMNFTTSLLRRKLLQMILFLLSHDITNWIQGI
jgi:hypothetical protein